MRRLLHVILPAAGLLVLSACSLAPRDRGLEGDEFDAARAAAEGAFVELEGGEAVPLPGMIPSPEEETLLTVEEAPAVREQPAPPDYEIKRGWFLVDTTQVFSNNIPPEQARLQVLQAARAGGLERALPPEVTFTSLLSDIMDETAGAAFEKSTWSTFALSSVTGALVEEKILSAGMQPVEGNAYRYRVVLEARVVPVKGERDPSLRLELEVNERLLATGDELVIRARATADGYLYIFDFLADQSVLLMFPNAYMSENAVSAGEWTEIPTPEERARGVHYRVAADPALPTTSETIYAVFSRQPIADLSGLIPVQEGYATFTAGDESFTDFQRWLAEIPLGRRTERMVQLHIVNDKEQ